jgi:hypothetical protein
LLRILITNIGTGKFVPKEGENMPLNENILGTNFVDSQVNSEQIPVTAELSGAAARIARGVGRHFRALDRAVLAELPLADGRRCDLMALDHLGSIAIVEIKSCIADFRSDRKWLDYRDWCDRFYFAVDAAFPLDVIPEDCGLILADRFGAETVREAPEQRLSAARRKAVTLRFARASALRLQQIADPESGLI